jgi:three-Cys-motif partner protein
MSSPEDPRRTPTVGLWSADKLNLLKCYLGGEPGRGGFLPATLRAGQRFYIDLFAGAGQNRVSETGQVIDGSPLIAIKAGPPTFTHLHRVESNSRNVASLESHRRDYPSRQISIWSGNANARINDILSVLPNRYPVFAFLDPRGAELDWHTVVRLAEHKPRSEKKIELFILFAYNQGLVRLMPHDPERMTNAMVLDRVMPDPVGWRRVYQRRIARAATPAELRRTMLDEYVRGLISLGYAFVPKPRLISTPDGHPLYFMIFASDHEAGDKIMSWCLKNIRDARRQLSLLGYEDQY